MRTLAVCAALVGAALSGLRWLRVAQREHYLPGSATTFAWRWWWGTGANRLLGLAAVLGIVLATGSPLSAVAAAVAVGVGPFGLGLRGRTSPLAWTRRLRTLAAVWAAVHLLVVTAGILAGAGPAVALAAAVLTPVLVDLALVLTAPVERRLAEPWVRRAAERLARVAPEVVAVTGSYGKTTTKGYIAHLVAGSRSVVATPASFNNRAGLARTLNEHLTPGTEVLVAEMGTYGPGEIAELCRLCPPSVAVICALGPVHLERMGSEEAILAAKAEILDGAQVAVLAVDHPLLADLAARRAATGQPVIRCSALDREAQVAVVAGQVLLSGRVVATLDPAAAADVHPANLACAVAVALELGVTEAALAASLPGLPTPAHRLTASRAPSGAVVLDDTYNANPAGGASALAALARQSRDDRQRVVVTPGMVELGNRQVDENRRFAAAAATVASHLLVVGHTNRAALVEGAGDGAAEVVLVDTREQAVAWVRQHVGEGDVVLYENDLPDHFV
ncbi:MAG: Mur ligase family protein [Acidimicrobiales bacterium]